MGSQGWALAKTVAKHATPIITQNAVDYIRGGNTGGEDNRRREEESSAVTKEAVTRFFSVLRASLKYILLRQHGMQTPELSS